MGSGTLKSGWTRVAFGDVVRLCTERASDPAAHGLECYVGLEHLDPGSLAIRRWGDVADGTTFTTVFRPGQVLFGKRRAYQRKVAVPDFTGVCSGDIYVLESSSDRHLLPELLPFVCQTEAFFEHAVGTSAGSLSPRTNWRSLAAYEFALPPLDEQRRIANVLSALESLRQHLLDLLAIHEKMLSSCVVDRLRSFSSTLPLNRLTDTIEYGTSLRTHSDKTGVPVLRIPNILRGVLDYGVLKYAHLSRAELARFRLADGDVLMVRTNGNPAYVGRCVVVSDLPETMAFASYLLRIVPKATRVRPEFVATALNAPSTRRELRAYVRSSAGNYNISASGLRSVSLPCPSLRDQDLLLEELATGSRARDAILLRLATLKQIRLPE